MTEPTTTTITTDGGIEVEVTQRGSGPDLVFFHGLVGPAPSGEPALDALAEQFQVHAPVWPGYGQLENEGSISDMLDFALLGWDIVDALDLDQPILVGHSFGAMIAAEMACLARHDLAKLVLVTPFGLWLDDHPLPDPFGVTPFELAELLFSDPANAAKLVAEGQDLSTDEGLAEFMVANSRRLGTAGKIMFPIPNRRLSKRLYRISAPTQLVMAGGDQLVTEAYREAWADQLPANQPERTDVIAASGHLVNLEQPDALATAIAEFCAG